MTESVLVGQIVYLVTRGDGYDEREITGIFSNKEVADDIVEKGNWDLDSKNYRVETIKVSDTPIEFHYSATWFTGYVDGLKKTRISIKVTEGKIPIFQEGTIRGFEGRVAYGLTPEEAEENLIRATKELAVTA
jgi:hypothetical protein